MGKGRGGHRQGKSSVLIVLSIVLEYTEGGAISWRDEQDRPVLTKKDSKRMFKDVVNGLDYCKSKKSYTFLFHSAHSFSS
jgi:serine/threonine protein kinase